MHIVVTDDGRLPYELQDQSFEVKVYTYDEFYQVELSVDEGLWLNVTFLEEAPYHQIIEMFKVDPTSARMLHLFRFADQPEPPYQIDEYVEVYGQPLPQTVPTPNQPQPEQIIQEAPPVVQQQQYVEPQQHYVEPQQQPVQENEPTPVYQQPAQQEEVATPDNMELNVNNINDIMAEGPTEEDLVKVIEGTTSVPPVDIRNTGFQRKMDDLLKRDEDDVARGNKKHKKADALVYLFGSAKGGTGKTTTSLMSAYVFAQLHPELKIAFADFDITDGQVSIALQKPSPTLFDFYKVYLHGKQTFSDLENCKVRSEYFRNVDFYFAMPQDIPEITDDMKFWHTVLELLLKNYDVVFFDSAIDYLDKKPVSMVYTIANKIYLTSNTSIISVKSVIKQIKTLAGLRKNNVFDADDHILDNIRVILTRVNQQSNDINSYIVNSFNEFVPVVGVFGNLDSVIEQIQWYQRWNLLDENVNPEIWNMIVNYLDDEDEEEEINDDNENL